jgi:hypothetical protein
MRHREGHMVGMGAWRHGGRGHGGLGAHGEHGGMGAWGQGAWGLEGTWWAWGHALQAWRMPHRIQWNRMLNGMSPLLVQRCHGTTAGLGYLEVSVDCPCN